MKSSFFFLLLVLCLVPKKSIAQNLDQYKYVIVPMKYGFMEGNDEYQLNSLTEFLFEKYGFTAILAAEDFPKDLIDNRCSALTADVIANSGMFSLVTKVTVILRNCNQEVIFKSKEGRSRLKKYKFAYQEALRDAFSSIKALNYSYSGTVGTKEKKIRPNAAATPKEHGTTIFELHDKAYVIAREGKALVLKSKETGGPVAFLNETSKGNFIFRSDKINGTAYFDGKGNLVVEYFDVDASTMKKRVYSRK